MAKLYLDTNKVFDITIRKPLESAKLVAGHQVYISPLSCHILYYSEGVRIPNKNFTTILSEFEIVNLNKEILQNSLEGPTSDLEDNIQLHSAADANCRYFLTDDKKLLKMKSFGKVKISNLL